MRVLKISTILILILLENTIASLRVDGQNVSNNIKSPIPDLTIPEVHYFKGREKPVDLKFSDLRGKWTIIDFWSEFCSGCIASFPHINALQKKYEEKVQFILIGIPYKNSERIKALYNRCKRDKNLNLSISFDSTLSNFFGVQGVPDILVIDPNGVIKGRTYKIDETEIEDFLAGKSPKLRQSSIPDSLYNLDHPYLYNENIENKSNHLHRTLFAAWDSTIPKAGILESPGRFEILGQPLKFLYKVAYFGVPNWTCNEKDVYLKYNSRLVLNIRDSTLFYKKNNQEISRFIYSTIYPVDPAPKDFNYRIENNLLLQNRVQNDLQNFLPYQAKVELRVDKYYSLRVNKNVIEKLKTKGEKMLKNTPYAPPEGFLYKNISIETLIAMIYNTPDFHKEIPIIDETNIKGNIDIKIDAVYFKDFLKELQLNGLDLILSEKKFKTIVLSDK